MMTPIYDQQQSCYYYSDLTQCHSFTPPLSPIIPPQMSYVSSSPPPSIRCPSTNLRNRFQYTIQQRWLLNEIFQHVPYPNSVQKNVIADRIGATREQIREYFIFLFKPLSNQIVGIWFQNRRRIAIQVHRSSFRDSNISSIDNDHSLQIELNEILVDLDLHKNAPQRMSISQNTSSSRRVRPQRK